ncbi:MAG: HD-GYP domain-containing protein [candidate division Zixibacteria bacterium]|nr:HD-GYP domain-containing protein [candidate division Zixibacteria bacterium]
MPVTSATPNTKNAPAFLAIPVETLRIDKILVFDIHINVGKDLILYRSSSLPFTEATKAKLIENKVNQVYVPFEAKDVYQKYIEENLPDVLQDPQIAEDKKAEILYDTSKTLAREVLRNPAYSENIRRSQNMVENTLHYILQGRHAFLNLMQITSFDYYTYTHSVNVSALAIALARQIGITAREELAEIGTGALLHDVGKSKVSNRILNKPTALNHAEFDIIMRHPEWGVDILHKTDLIPSESYYAVSSHHERIDGSGYPNGTNENNQHLYGRIVAICDVFDAMTTRRVYQKAMDSYPALKIMHGMKKALDPELLRQFTILMGPDRPENFY